MPAQFGVRAATNGFGAKRPMSAPPPVELLRPWGCYARWLSPQTFSSLAPATSPSLPARSRPRHYSISGDVRRLHHQQSAHVLHQQSAHVFGVVAAASFQSAEPTSLSSPSSPSTSSEPWVPTPLPTLHLSSLADFGFGGQQISPSTTAVSAVSPRVGPSAGSWMRDDNGDDRRRPVSRGKIGAQRAGQPASKRSSPRGEAALWPAKQPYGEKQPSGQQSSPPGRSSPTASTATLWGKAATWAKQPRGKQSIPLERSSPTGDGGNCDADVGAASQPDSPSVPTRARSPTVRPLESRISAADAATL
jgi:hypothetical protein